MGRIVADGRASAVVILATVALAACGSEKPQATKLEPTPSPVTTVNPPVAPAPVGAPVAVSPTPPRTASVPAWKTVTLQLIDDKIIES